jgi:hypothetical protein
LAVVAAAAVVTLVVATAVVTLVVVALAAVKGFFIEELTVGWKTVFTGETTGIFDGRAVDDIMLMIKLDLNNKKY